MIEKAKELLLEVVTEDVIEKLAEIKYFVSPASSKHHLSVEGGLVEHSINVTNSMLDLNDKLNLGLDRKKIILIGMLHDVCKAGSYEPKYLKSGERSDKEPFIYNSQIELGHAANSLYVINNKLHIELTDDVAQAIYWHMGFDFEKDNYAINNLKKNPVTMMYVWLIQTADRFATWIIEEGKNNGE